jgi:hypothetical protein
VFEKGNEVVVLYDCETKNGGGSRNAEFFTIEGNKIKEVEVYWSTLVLSQRKTTITVINSNLCFPDESDVTEQRANSPFKRLDQPWLKKVQP